MCSRLCFSAHGVRNRLSVVHGCGWMKGPTSGAPCLVPQCCRRAGNSAFLQDRWHCIFISHCPLARSHSRPHLIQKQGWQRALGSQCHGESGNTLARLWLYDEGGGHQCLCVSSCSHGRVRGLSSGQSHCRAAWETRLRLAEGSLGSR